MDEEWRPIVGYEGLYEVSNLGRVRSFDRSVTHRVRGNGICTKVIKGRVLRQIPSGSRSQYRSVALYTRYGKDRKRYVHALVMEAFVGQCPSGYEVCHRNGRPTENWLDNLRYGTRADNMQDAILHGTSPRGERNPMAKLKNVDVLSIRRRAFGIELEALADEYGVKLMTIRNIVKWKTWTWLKEESHG